MDDVPMRCVECQDANLPKGSRRGIDIVRDLEKDPIPFLNLPKGSRRAWCHNQVMAEVRGFRR